MPGHEVVASRGPSGEAFCCADCVVTRRALQGREILQFCVSLPVPDGDALPACVLAIPERSPDDGEAVVVLNPFTGELIGDRPPAFPTP